MTEENEPPIVPIEPLEMSDNYYNDGYRRYNAMRLFEHSKQFQRFEMPLAGINLGVAVWGNDVMNMSDFIYHCKRVENTSLEYPILLDSDGTICDGWHRIARAVLEGRSTITAIRLDTMPEPDEILKDES